MASPVISGNTITFPAGTPSSIMSAYYNYILRQRAQPQQDWFDKYAQPWIDQTLNPYMANIFLNDPRKRDMTAFETDQKIRQNAAANDSMTQALLQRLRDEELARQESQTVTGQGLGAFTNIQKNLTQPAFTTDTGPTPEYGAFEEPWATSPSPDVPTPQTGQDVSRTFASSPGFTPSTADVFRTLAGQNPMLTGRTADLFAKHPTFAAGFDPLQEQARAAKVAAQESQTKLNLTKSETMAGDLQRKIDELNLVKKPVAESQIGVNQARADQLNQLVQTAEGKQTIQDMVLGMLQSGASMADVAPYLAVLSGKPPSASSSPYTKSAQLQIDILNETDPVKKKLLQDALNAETDRQATIAGAQAKARVDVTGPQSIYQHRLSQYETKMEDLAATRQIVDQIAALSRQISIPDPSARVKGYVGRETSAMSQSDSVYAMFASKAGLLANLARSISGERGTLNEGDVKRIQALMPTYHDIDSVRQQKLLDLYEFLNTKQQRFKSMLTSPTGNAGNPSSTYLGDTSSPGINSQGWGPPSGSLGQVQ